jgi:hypothetical protein
MALGNTDSTSPLITNGGYSHTFGMVGWCAIGAGVLLFCAIPFVSRLTQEKKVINMRDESDEATAHVTTAVAGDSHRV